MSSAVVRQVTITGLAMLPDDYQLAEGGVLRAPEGTLYTVGPALYRLAPEPELTAQTALPTQGPKYTTTYVPYEAWPAGVELDDTMFTAFGPPLAARPE